MIGMRRNPPKKGYPTAKKGAVRSRCPCLDSRRKKKSRWATGAGNCEMERFTYRLLRRLA